MSEDNQRSYNSFLEYLTGQVLKGKAEGSLESELYFFCEYLYQISWLSI